MCTEWKMQYSTRSIIWTMIKTFFFLNFMWGRDRATPHCHFTYVSKQPQKNAQGSRGKIRVLGYIPFRSLPFPHDEQSKNWQKMASPLVLCSAGLKYIHREALSQNDLSCSYRVVWANITILIGQKVKLINIFSVGLWLFTSCDSISFLAVMFMFWNGEKDDKWLPIRSLLSYLRHLGWSFDHEMISL